MEKRKFEIPRPGTPLSADKIIPPIPNVYPVPGPMYPGLDTELAEENVFGNDLPAADLQDFGHTTPGANGEDF
jgi:hypothetical protein